MAADGLVQQCRVEDRPGARPGLVERRRQRDEPVARDPAVGRLHPDGAGDGPGLADRAAGVGAHASGAWNDATAAAEPPPRAAGDPRQVPWVVSGAVRRVLGGGAHRELVHVGLAQDDEARVLAGGWPRWRRTAGPSPRGSATRTWWACPPWRKHVLDGDRHAGQRTERLTGCAALVRPRGPPPGRRRRRRAGTRARRRPRRRCGPGGPARHLDRRLVPPADESCGELGGGAAHESGRSSRLLLEDARHPERGPPRAAPAHRTAPRPGSGRGRRRPRGRRWSAAARARSAGCRRRRPRTSGDRRRGSRRAGAPGGRARRRSGRCGPAGEVRDLGTGQRRHATPGRAGREDSRRRVVILGARDAGVAPEAGRSGAVALVGDQGERSTDPGGMLVQPAGGCLRAASAGPRRILGRCRSPAAAAAARSPRSRRPRRPRACPRAWARSMIERTIDSSSSASEQAGDERAVDLDLGDGQALEHEHRGVAGPEVVEAQRDVECLERRPGCP